MLIHQDCLCSARRTVTLRLQLQQCLRAAAGGNGHTHTHTHTHTQHKLFLRDSCPPFLSLTPNWSLSNGEPSLQLFTLFER